tara:strand:- start:1504 stop:2682 length:1179 start_codon:yes stop_codon:yes gene_type:complete
MSNINVNTLTPLAGTSGTVNVSGSLHVSGNLSANGNLTFGNETTDTISMSADLSSSIIPDIDNAFTLGSAAYTWKAIYADTGSFNTIQTSGSSVLNITSASISYLTGSSPTIVGAALIPDIDNTHDLGSASKEWKDLYVDGIAYIDKISGSATGADGALTASVDIVPGVDNKYNLGTPTLEWNNLYVDGVAYIDHLSGSSNDGADTPDSTTTCSVHLVPGTDNYYNLGASGKEWNDLHVDGVGYIDSLGAAAGDTNIAYINKLSGSAAKGDITASVNIQPQVTDKYDLGSATKEWKNIHVMSASVGNGKLLLHGHTSETPTQRNWTSGSLVSVASPTATASLQVSASHVEILFRTLPTTQGQARAIGTGSLWVSGSGIGGGAQSKYLMVFTG